MVNLSKRMHQLMPLWLVKSGPGAAILPPKPPLPQLTSLTLRLPNPCNAYDTGARLFWKTFLPGLRYHNLTLPINVEQSLRPGPSFSPTMTLVFESQTRESLADIKTTPPTTDVEALEEAKKHQIELADSRKLDEVEGRRKHRTTQTWVELLRIEQEKAGIPENTGTQIGQIETKAQPAVDPATPSSTSPPATVFTRTITMGLRGRKSLDIWNWFKHMTGARQYRSSKDDVRRKRQYKRFFKSAEKDRLRVKEGVDAVRREKEDLARAREAADRLAAEA